MASLSLKLSNLRNAVEFREQLVHRTREEVDARFHCFPSSKDPRVLISDFALKKQQQEPQRGQEPQQQQQQVEPEKVDASVDLSKWPSPESSPNTPRGDSAP